MKKKSIIGLFLALFGVSVTTTSCEDMLTPDVDLYAYGFTGKDTVNFYFGILSCVQDVIENDVLLGDLRSDLIDTTSYVSDTVANVANFVPTANGNNGLLDRSRYYKVINQCNFYLAACDTLAQKNNIYYMRREYAQVQMIRAWTYMHLVQNYGRVPFIYSPVDNSNTGWETNPEGGWATPDNLLDLLIEQGLLEAYAYEEEYGTPYYGTVSNGYTTYYQSMMVFPGDLVLGDLYLLRGASKADYEQAATYYYNYMSEMAEDERLVTGDYATGMNSMTRGSSTIYTHQPGSWASFMDGAATLTTTGEVITMMLSAANSTFGTVLTRAAQIYGFDPSSSSSTTSDDDEVSTSGVISVTADYRDRQVAASNAYQNLSTAQVYRDNTFNGSEEDDFDADNISSVKFPEGVGDARISGTVVNVNTNAGTLPFIQKRCYYGSTNLSSGTSTTSFAYNYTFPLYRMRQVYLRYAEAINRAGYPRHAFAVLRDGLNRNTIPTYNTDSVVNNQYVANLDSVINGCNYIGVDEIRRAEDVAFLDFSSSDWDDVVGIHELACGASSDLDTVYTYAKIVGQRMADEEARVSGQSSAALAQKYISLLDETSTDETTEGTDDTTTDDTTVTDTLAVADPAPADSAEINAVETLIADELALESAFEGQRYYDLMRIARHKNNDLWGYCTGDYGTYWMAWLIARRSENLAPYEEPTQYNSTLYNRLITTDGWYLMNPEY